MFEKVTDAAEKLATNISRRQALLRFGTIFGGALLGSLAFTGKAQASWCRTGSGGLQYCSLGQICTAIGCQPIRPPSPKPKPQKQVRHV